MKFVFASLFISILISCTSTQEKMEPTTGSLAEKNKELIRRAAAEMVNKQNYDLIDSFFAVNIFDHGAFEGQEQGLAGFKKAVSEFLGSFSKVDLRFEDIIAEGDLVATIDKWKVIRKSDNKELTGETMHWFRIKDGKITDEWSKGWEWIGK